MFKCSTHLVIIVCHPIKYVEKIHINSTHVPLYQIRVLRAGHGHSGRVHVYCVCCSDMSCSYRPLSLSLSLSLSIQ